MRIDTQLSAPLGSVAEEAKRLRAAGFDGGFTFEGPNDVFLPLVEAAQSGLDIYTNVAIAFPRSPLHLAHTAWDLQRLSGGRFRSFTTYGGRLEHSLGPDRRGRVTFLGMGTGFEALERMVPRGVDKVGVFQLIQPTFGGWWRTPHGDVDVVVGASADVAMVGSLARMNVPLMEGLSVLRTRGYYYATGATAFARMSVRRGRVNLDLDSTAHQFWSYDDHSYRGEDPKDLTDARVISSAALGLWLSPVRDIRIELFTTSTLRRGTGNGMTATEQELDGGVALKAGF